jgi:hypothetical protein
MDLIRSCNVAQSSCKISQRYRRKYAVNQITINKTQTPTATSTTSRMILRPIGTFSHYRQAMGDNPFFTAFTRSLTAALEVTHTEDKISMICDDEEESAWPMYQLFRKVKILYPDAREKLQAITFPDDRWSFGLQPADLIVSLTRQEVAKRFLGLTTSTVPPFWPLAILNRSMATRSGSSSLDSVMRQCCRT